MITEKLHLALNKDDMNSPLIILLNELFIQGYQIKLEGVAINKDDLDHPSILDLEHYNNAIFLEINKKNSSSTKIKLEYFDYHKVKVSEIN